MSTLLSPDAMTLLDKSSSPMCSEDNSASFPGSASKGGNSRASSPRSSHTAGSSSRRETRAPGAGVLPGPVSRGKTTRNVVYYQNRFIVIDSTPAAVSSTTATTTATTSGSSVPPQHKAPSASPTTNLCASGAQPRGGALTSAVIQRAGGGASRGGARGEAGAGDGSKRKATNVATTAAAVSFPERHQEQRRMASSISAATTTTTACSGSGGGGGSSSSYRTPSTTGAVAASSVSYPSSVTASNSAVASDRHAAGSHNHHHHHHQQHSPNNNNSTAGGGRGVGAAVPAVRCSPHTKTTTAAMDASSVAMDGRGIEIIVSDETGMSHRPDKQTRVMSKRAAALKRLGKMLEDNRMKGRENCQHLLTENPEEYRVLKKVLNIIFVTVGVALLVSVFVVIVYTAVAGDKETVPGSAPEAAHTQSHNTTQSPSANLSNATTAAPSETETL